MTKKTCTKCSIEKNLGDFRRDKTQKDGRQPSCKLCARQITADRYTDRYSEKTKERNAKARQVFCENLLEYKTGRSCIKCDENDVACLEFHHIDPDQKDFTISNNRTRKWNKVLEEIAKCVILCSNCHQKYHAGRFTLENIILP